MVITSQCYNGRKFFIKRSRLFVKNQPTTGWMPVARTAEPVNTGEFDPEMMRRLANGEHTVEHEIFKKYGREGWQRAKELAKNYK